MKVIFYPSIFKDKKKTILRPEIEKGRFVLSRDKINKKGETVKEYCVFKTVKALGEFISITPKEERNFYEFRKGPVTKFFFDVDLKFSEVGLIEAPTGFIESIIKIITCVLHYFFINDDEDYTSLMNIQPSQIRIYTSSNHTKESYHIVIDGYHISDVTWLKQIARVINNSINCFYGFPDNTEIVDEGVYSPKNASLRLLGSRKIGTGDDRVKRSFSKQEDIKSIKKSLISFIPKDSILIDTPPTFLDYKAEETPGENDFDDFDEIITSNEIDRVRIAVMNVDAHRSDNFRDWTKYCFALKNGGYPFEIFNEFSARSDKYDYDTVFNTWERVPERSQSSRNHVTVKSIFYDLKRDNPKVFEALKQTHGVSARSVFNRSKKVDSEIIKREIPHAEINIINERYLPAGEDNAEDLIIKSYLGTGKTQYITNLPEIKDTSKNVLIIVNRVKLAKEFFRRFFKYNFNIYTDLKTPEDREEPLEGAFGWNRVIIQPESMWKIPKWTYYDLIILDEVESSTTQWSSTTMGTREMEKRITPTLQTFEFSRFEETAFRFVHFLKRCKRVVMADAFISMKSITLYSSLNRKNRAKVVLNEWIPPPRKAIQIPMGCNHLDIVANSENLTPLFEVALSKLKAGKKIFFVFSSSSKLEDFVEFIKDHNYNGVAYSGKRNNSKGSEFIASRDWMGRDYVCITTSITTGVDFSEKHFDCVFCYFQSTPLARDIFQSIMRVRHLNDEEMYYSISKYSFPQRGSINIGGILKEIEGVYSHLSEEWKKLITIKDTDVMKNIIAYNTQEKRLNGIIYNYIVENYMNSCNYIIQSSESHVEAKYIELPPSEFNFTEVWNIVKNIDDEGIGMIYKRIGTPSQRENDTDVLAMHQFINVMRLDVKIPEFETDFCSAYTYLRENEKARINCMKLGKYISRDWEKQNETEALDPSNPKIRKILEYEIIDKLTEQLRLNSIAYSDSIAKGVIDSLNPKELRDWSVEVWKMNEVKFVKGKDGKTKRAGKLSVSKENNPKYIRHIIEKFTGGSFRLSKKQVQKRVDGKVTDVTPYLYNPPPKLATLSNLSASRNSPE